MDEFGQHPVHENASSEDHWDEKTAQAENQKDNKDITTPPQTPEPKARRPPPMNLTEAKRPVSRRKEEPPSPAPFAHYTQAQAMDNTMERPRTPPIVIHREDDGAGCCRCVIM